MTRAVLCPLTLLSKQPVRRPERNTQRIIFNGQIGENASILESGLVLTEQESSPLPSSLLLLCPHCSTPLQATCCPLFDEEGEARVRDASVFSMLAAQLSNPLRQLPSIREDPGLTFATFPQTSHSIHALHLPKSYPSSRSKTCIFPQSSSSSDIGKNLGPL